MLLSAEELDGVSPAGAERRLRVLIVVLFEVLTERLFKTS